MLTRQRLNVHLYVTPTCNLKCIHCYSDALPLNTKVDRLLTIDEMGHVINGLCETYDTAFDIEGGEFFVRKDIDRLFDVVPQNHWRNITLTTNGITKINMDPDIFRNLDEFRVSVEGHTDDLQRTLRGIPLRPVIKTCTELMSHGVPITLRITLHRKNYHNILEMLHYFLNLGFMRFSLYEYQSSGRGADQANDYELDAFQIQNVLNQLIAGELDRKVESFKLSLSARRVHPVQESAQLLRAKGFQVVDLSGVASLTVNYNGVLGVCPWNVVHENSGIYQDDNFLPIIQNRMDMGELDHACTHCSSIRIERKL
jgi:MoaA/NifB/PqqE/SkfB family radical SAM enzyme